MAYTMNYANEKGKFDEEVTDKGVRLLIEPSALMHIIGTKMDFVSDRLKYAHLTLNTLLACHVPSTSRSKYA